MHEPPVRLTRDELPVDTTALARYLIGKMVVHDSAEGRTAGRIAETEAYLPGDAACHAFRGQTPRNRVLFMERGHAYLYISYGMHLMLNVTGETAGIGAGVLLRALEPTEGVALMQARRGLARLSDLARGPGRLAQALKLTMALNGIDLCADGPLWLGRDAAPSLDIAVSARIGITKGVDRPLRFYVSGSRFVSGRRRAPGQSALQGVSVPTPG